MHLIYIDSGSDEELCVFSALAVPAPCWRECFNMLRGFRHSLKVTDGIYVHKEIHAWKFVSGRGAISDRVVPKGRRCAVFVEFLTLLTTLPGVRLLNAVFPRKQDERAFERLMNRINRMMETSNDQALLICDEGKEAEYTRLVRRMGAFNYIRSQFGTWADGRAMRNIPIDRVIEDPVFKRSDRSYFIQAADCCAYALLRRERPVESKTKYGLDKAFTHLSESGILLREASRRDPEGILRP